jgi:hypothetical protein
MKKRDSMRSFLSILAVMMMSGAAPSAETPVDLRRADQLVFDADPQATDLALRYPLSALRDGVEAKVDVTCVVRPDLTADCPHIAVGTTGDERMVRAFRRASWSIARLFRLAPQTKDGKSPVGIWFRKTISFKLQE